MKNKIALLLLIAVCAIAAKWELTVIFNNDRHGDIAPGAATFMNPETPPPLGIFPSEAAVVKHFREATKKSGAGFLYLDQGDIYQGAPVGSLTKGEAIVAAYNALMPDVVVAGNHEFDDGQANFEKLVRLAKFPWVTANLIDNSTGKRVEGLHPYIIKKFPLQNKEELVVGIIGVTTRDTKTMSFPENTAGIEVLDEVTTINAYAETLRTLHNADFIIVCAHMGLPFDAMEAFLKTEATAAQYDEGHYSGTDLVKAAKLVKGVDVMFGGHIHVGYREPWEDPTTHVLVFQNYAHGTGFGSVNFLFDPATKVFLGYEPLAKDNALVSLFSDEFWPDANMASLVDSLQEESNKGLAEPVAEALALLPRGDASSNKVGHIMCDAMIEATGADISTTNMGGVRAELPAGTITRADVFTTMPFDNKIIVVQLSGSDAVAVFERMAGKYTGALVGGAKVVFDTETEKIIEMHIGGEPVDSTKTYSLATSDYVYYSYGVPQLEKAPKDKVRFTGMLMRTAIENWLKNHSPVSPATDGRWRNVEKK